jgi:beta-galactosidase
MHYGCAWYPEHWPRERWDTDLALMREAGMTVVRVGEFAWSRMEPADGRFDFDWLDAALERASAHGLVAVIGTPTAAPPAWLTAKHPEVLRVQADGRVLGHGARQHANPAHPTYLDYCRRIADALGARYGGHRAVIGWQLDNEVGHVSFDPLTRARFQTFCRARYDTLDALNAAWSTAYWSQEYTAWEEIPFALERQNACLLACAREFVTDVWRGYLMVQAEALWPHLRRAQFITHNFSHEFAKNDPYDVCEALDFASVDPYVFTGHLNPATMGMYLAATRGITRGPFWVMETQPGAVNYMAVNNALDPSETRRMVWHQVGHGADAVLFWQWRSAPGGQEQLHGTILASDGRPRPLYEEIARVGRELARASAALAGTTVRPRVALAWSYRDRAQIEECLLHRDYDPWRIWCEHYGALRRLGLDAEALRADTDLTPYALVVAPQMVMLEAELEAHLLAYVESGGHLLLGPRTGMVDGEGALLPARQPGPLLAQALGSHVEEFYALERPVHVHGPAGVGMASTWGEWVAEDGHETQVLLRYGEGCPWLAGQAALVSRSVGRGRLSYLGACLDADGLLNVAEWACRVAGVSLPWGRLPEGIEVSCREGEGRRVYVLINHGATERRLQLPFDGVCALAGEPVAGELVLPGHEVRVLIEEA